jgi:hypothetical protein
METKYQMHWGLFFFLRSQLGTRDSEVAMMIEDTDMVPSRMNGTEVTVFLHAGYDDPLTQSNAFLRHIVQGWSICLYPTHTLI